MVAYDIPPAGLTYLPGREMWKEGKFRFIRSVDRCRSLLGSDASECNPCGTYLGRYDRNHNFTYAENDAKGSWKGK